MTMAEPDEYAPEAVTMGAAGRSRTNLSCGISPGGLPCGSRRFGSLRHENTVNDKVSVIGSKVKEDSVSFELGHEPHKVIVNVDQCC